VKFSTVGLKAECLQPNGRKYFLTPNAPKNIDMSDRTVRITPLNPYRSKSAGAATIVAPDKPNSNPAIVGIIIRTAMIGPNTIKRTNFSVTHIGPCASRSTTGLKYLGKNRNLHDCDDPRISLDAVLFSRILAVAPF
jgi:hypothetical protein